MVVEVEDDVDVVCGSVVVVVDVLVVEVVVVDVEDVGATARVVVVDEDAAGFSTEGLANKVA
jgi:hypothetical protein